MQPSEKNRFNPKEFLVQDSLTPNKAITQYHDQYGIIITDLILTRSDPFGSPESNHDYIQSIWKCGDEIFQIASEDFHKRFPDAPLPDRIVSHIHDGDTLQLRAFGQGDLADYHLYINRTDFPGRVELVFTPLNFRPFYPWAFPRLRK
jgi:hypothetical protein